MRLETLKWNLNEILHLLEKRKKNIKKKIQNMQIRFPRIFLLCAFLFILGQIHKKTYNFLWAHKGKKTKKKKYSFLKIYKNNSVSFQKRCNECSLFPERCTYLKVKNQRRLANSPESLGFWKYFCSQTEPQYQHWNKFCYILF